MRIETEYFKDWETRRQHHKDRQWINGGKEEITLKTLYPKWVAWVVSDVWRDSTVFSETYTGETEEEAKGKAVEWLRGVREEITKIIEKEEKSATQEVQNPV